MNLVFRIISFVFYIVIFAPIAMVARLCGYDPLALKGNKETHWTSADRAVSFKKQ